jgi:hypothetical protein
MAKKFCSIIIVPHTKTNFRTIAFSKRTLQAATIGGGILVLLLVAGIFDYVSLSVMRHKYRVLIAETSEQQRKITEYEASIDRLKSTISGFEAYTKKLNVMAGLKSPDIIRDPAGLGGSDPAAEGASGPQLGPPPGPTPLGQIQNLAILALRLPRRPLHRQTDVPCRARHRHRTGQSRRRHGGRSGPGSYPG